MGERTGAYWVLVHNHEERRQIGRPKLRGEDNIKINFREVEREAWTRSTWLRIGTGGELL